MITVEYGFTSTDPVMHVLLREIRQIPDSEPERHEAEAYLLMTLAKVSWRKADQIRARRSEDRAERSET